MVEELTGSIAKLPTIFVLNGQSVNLPPNLCLCPHELMQLSNLTRQISFFTGGWLTERLAAGQDAESKSHWNAQP